MNSRPLRVRCQRNPNQTQGVVGGFSDFHWPVFGKCKALTFSSPRDCGVVQLDVGVLSEDPNMQTIFPSRKRNLRREPSTNATFVVGENYSADVVVWLCVSNQNNHSVRHIITVTVWFENGTVSECCLNTMSGNCSGENTPALVNHRTSLSSHQELVFFQGNFHFQNIAPKRRLRFSEPNRTPPLF